jgi:hypothetical protein
MTMYVCECVFELSFFLFFIIAIITVFINFKFTTILHLIHTSQLDTADI